MVTQRKYLELVEHSLKHKLVAKELKTPTAPKKYRQDGKIVYEAWADFETLSPEKKAEYSSLIEQGKEIPLETAIYSWTICFELAHQPFLPKQNPAQYRFKQYKGYLFVYGINITTFFEFCKMLKRTFIIMFNNGRAFDLHFILKAMEDHNFYMMNPDEKAELLQEKLGDKYRPSMLRKKLFNHEYTLWNDEAGKIYEIRMRWARNKSDKTQVIFGCNLWLFAGSIKNFGKTLRDNAVAKGMNVKEANDYFLKKELIDNQGKAYQKHQGYETIEALEEDGNELEYMLQDAFILAEFRKSCEQVLPRERWKTTSASTAFDYNKTIFTDHLINDAITTKHIKKIILENGIPRYFINKPIYGLYPRRKGLDGYKLKEKIFNYWFPLDWSKDTITDANGREMTLHHYIIQTWFNGGITLVNPRYQNRVLKRQARMLDIKSSYPSSMYQKMMPYGAGKKGDVKGYDFKLMTIKAKRKLINRDGLPFVHVKNIKSKRKDWLSVVDVDSTLYLTSPEFQRFKEYYNIQPGDIELTIDYSFKQTIGKAFFKNYIELWFAKKDEAKKHGNSILEYIAKLFLNSLYGRFGMDSEREARAWDPITKSWLMKTAEITAVSQYIPMAVAITAESRMKLVDGVGHHYDQFVYADTDSCLWLVNDKNEFTNFAGQIAGNGKGVELLGQWEAETKYPSVKFCCRRPKQYIIWFNHNEVDKKSSFIKFRYAGLRLNHHAIRTITDADILGGRTFGNQLTQRNVKGGKLILDTEKQITPAWSKNFTRAKSQVYYSQQEIMAQYLKDNQQPLTI